MVGWLTRNDQTGVQPTAWTKQQTVNSLLPKTMYTGKISNKEDKRVLLYYIT